MTRIVKCAKLGREAEGLDTPPYPGELGKKIWQQISKEAWQMWLRQQTMLINENRLSGMDPNARKYLMEQANLFLFAGGGDTVKGYVPPIDKHPQ